jgi:DNA-binding transcriptional MocR family regulator
VTPPERPFERLNRYAYDAGRGKARWGVTDALPPGKAKLVRQIARRYLENGMAVDPNEIIITVGATEAINLCLQAVAKPGDVIAVESPTFYGMLPCNRTDEHEGDRGVDSSGARHRY